MPQLPVVPRKLSLEWDCLERTIRIVENDFSTIEALGVLESAKAMISANWLKPIHQEGD